MAAALPFLQIAGAVFSVIGALSAGANAKAQGQYNAAIASRNADAARQQAAVDAQAQQRRATQIIGASRAAYGASGITLEGSPLDVLASSAMAAELDKQNILYKGELRATGYQETAALDLSRGQAGERAGYIGAGSAILMGGAKYYDQQERLRVARGGAQTGYRIEDYED